jgi:hypothetical protein
MSLIIVVAFILIRRSVGDVGFGIGILSFVRDFDGAGFVGE